MLAELLKDANAQKEAALAEVQETRGALAELRVQKDAEMQRLAEQLIKAKVEAGAVALQARVTRGRGGVVAIVCPSVRATALEGRGVVCVAAALVVRLTPATATYLPPWVHADARCVASHRVVREGGRSVTREGTPQGADTQPIHCSHRRHAGPTQQRQQHAAVAGGSRRHGKHTA